MPVWRRHSPVEGTTVLPEIFLPEAAVHQYQSKLRAFGPFVSSIADFLWIFTHFKHFCCSLLSLPPLVHPTSQSQCRTTSSWLWRLKEWCSTALLQDCSGRFRPFVLKSVLLYRPNQDQTSRWVNQNTFFFFSTNSASQLACTQHVGCTPVLILNCVVLLHHFRFLWIRRPMRSSRKWSLIMITSAHSSCSTSPSWEHTSCLWRLRL